MSTNLASREKKILLIARTYDCPRLDSLTRYLDHSQNYYKVLFLDNDKVLNRYVKKNFRGQCPLIFVDNIYRGNGVDVIQSIDKTLTFHESNIQI